MVKRSAGLMMEVLVWATALVGDVASNAVEKNAPIRAKALKELIARQGAAFAASSRRDIRPDLLPPAYLEEFQTLLDQVEAFLGGCEKTDSKDDWRKRSVGKRFRGRLVLRRTHRHK